MRFLYSGILSVAFMLLACGCTQKPPDAPQKTTLDEKPKTVGAPKPLPLPPDAQKVK
jgi:hypothetical protein